MILNKAVVEKAVAEQSTGRINLPKGWYKTKILEVEDREGKDSDSQNLYISARVYMAGAFVTEKGASLPEGVKTVKQSWNVNYVQRDGKTPNPYGQATCASLVEAAGAGVDDGPDGTLHVEVDQFEGATVWAYITMGKSSTKTVEDENGAPKVITYDAKNEVRAFKDKDIEDPTKRAAGAAGAEKATAALKEQAAAAAKAEEPKGGKVHDKPFDDEVPF